MHGCYPRMPAQPSVLDNKLTAYQTDQMVNKLLDDLAKASAVYREQRNKAAEKDKMMYDYVHKQVDFEPGDVVWRYIPRTLSGPQGKFAIPWSGPYVVVERLGELPTYRIRNEKKEEDTVHASQLASFAAFSRVPRTDAEELISPSLSDVIAATESMQRDVLPSEMKDKKTSQSDKKESATASESESLVDILGVDPPSLAPSAPLLHEAEDIESVTPEMLERKVLEPKGVDQKMDFRGKFVIVSAPGRPGEELLYKITGDDLLGHRWTSVRVKGDSPGKTFGPLYYDERQMKHETLTEKQIKSGLKGRTPDLGQLKKGSILFSFEKLDKRRIPESSLESFVATYGRPPWITWRP